MEGVNQDEGQSSGSAGDGDYCRQVEAYLCRKNDGHLIRIAGPAFTRVCEWAAEGVPLNVVYRGIDRYFERYYARGPRRRPVQIEFCENDVLDVFDEWRRAVGGWVADERREAEGARRKAEPARTTRSSSDPALAGSPPASAGVGAAPAGSPPDEVKSRRHVSLPAHLERVIVRLTTLRAGARLTPQADAAVTAAIRGLDAARGAAGQVAGAARDELLGRLRTIDGELVAALRESIGKSAAEAIDREADGQLAPFRAGMPDDAYQRAVAASAARLLRERTGLPVVEYHGE